MDQLERRRDGLNRARNISSICDLTNQHKQCECKRKVGLTASVHRNSHFESFRFARSFRTEIRKNKTQGSERVRLVISKSEKCDVRNSQSLLGISHSGWSDNRPESPVH